MRSDEEEERLKNEAASDSVDGARKTVAIMD